MPHGKPDLTRVALCLVKVRKPPEFAKSGHFMDTIIENLFAFVLTAMNFQGDIQPPELVGISKQQIESAVCGGRTCTAIAYYDDISETVYILDAINLKTSISGRGYVLHEMVHHVQKSIHNFTVKNIDCNRRLALEREAYEIQMQYLIAKRENPFQIRYILSRLPYNC